jgi:hypothetical protein
MDVSKPAVVADHIDNVGEKDYHHRRQDDDTTSVRSEALGDDLPEGYFYSVRFLGAMAGFCLSAISAYIFLILPTNVLTYINADIGKSTPYIYSH